MSISIPLKFPLTVGKSEINSMENLKSEIKLGRWANLEEDFTKPVKWERVKAWGSIVDRSIGDIDSATTQDELGVLTKFENPETGMPNYELLPIDSELFDVDNMPNDDLIDSYSEVNIRTTYAKKDKYKINPESKQSDTIYSLLTVMGIALVLKGEEMITYLSSILKYKV
jgi:hypothetical protein